MSHEVSGSAKGAEIPVCSSLEKQRFIGKGVLVALFCVRELDLEPDKGVHLFQHDWGRLFSCFRNQETALPPKTWFTPSL